MIAAHPTRRRTGPIALLAALLVLASGWALLRHTTPDTRPEAAEPPLQGFEIECARVIDGDTIELSGGERVRYIGIDTPEMRPVEPWAEAATEANRALVEGRVLRLVLDVEERDRYGRLLAYVWVDDTFVNAELVRRGLAQVSTYPPNVRYQDYFLKLQREARRAGRGLWAQPS